jgi:hypothetical protein
LSSGIINVCQTKGKCIKWYELTCNIIFALALRFFKSYIDCIETQRLFCNRKGIYNMANTKVNYTDEMVNTAKTFYAENGNEGMSELATLLGRSVRSVRAKLVREGVYVADVKPEPKPKDEGPTKAELLEAVEATGFNTEGLEGATKAALARVLAVVSA